MRLPTGSGGGGRAAGRRLLERTGLLAARGRLAGQLSGGMRQKLGVIAAMLHHPALLVLDEPTTGVDPVSRADLWWLIARAAADGAAVVFATSYLDEAERAAQCWSSRRAGNWPRAPGGDRRGHARRSLGRAWPAGRSGRARSWRRDGHWRVWAPGRDRPAQDAEPVRPDLQDAVTVAIIARELPSRASW